MKTQETKSAQMDDIVFEKRNKMYGAYLLRKLYNKQVNKALMLATAILIAGLAYPVVSSYNALRTGKYIPNDPGVIFTSPPDAKDADAPTPPPLPPPAAETEAIKRFVPPIVTEDEVPPDLGLPVMDDLNTKTKNVLINITPETPIENHPVIIEVPVEKQETFTIVEEMPTFTGGETERLKFLSENINYPQLAADNGIQGIVYVKFIIDSRGNITDSEVIRGIGGGCDEEALRVVKAMPQWHPGKQNGRTVRVQFTMPIIFKLQG